jgi:RND family efflux transporter MFP subunit
MVMIGVAVCIILVLGVAVYAVRTLSAVQDVTLYQVGVQNVNQYVGGGGIVFPNQQFNLSYQFVERAQQVLVKNGDAVAAGQPLIQLDPTQLNVQVQQAAANVAAEEQNFANVSASGNAVSIANAQTALAQAKNNYNALLAQISSPELKNGALIAPFAGIVTGLTLNSHEVISPNMTLLTLMDVSSVIVHVKVPLANISQVHLNQAAVVTPSVLPNLSLNGKVISIVPQADPQTDTFEVWVQVNNPDKILLPGMSAFARIQSSAHAYVVPRLALLDPYHESAVFVARNQHAYLQPVRVVGRSVDGYYVDQGLSNGDKVVITGIDALKDGDQIRSGGTEQATS